MPDSCLNTAARCSVAAVKMNLHSSFPAPWEYWMALPESFCFVRLTAVLFQSKDGHALITALKRLPACPLPLTFLSQIAVLSAGALVGTQGCRVIALNSLQKFREFLEGSNLISKLQAKHDLLKRTLGEGIVTISFAVLLF